jgi:hypothetical protein
VRSGFTWLSTRSIEKRATDLNHPGISSVAKGLLISVEGFFYMDLVKEYLTHT